MDFIKPLCEMSSRTAGLIFLVSIVARLFPTALRAELSVVRIGGF